MLTIAGIFLKNQVQMKDVYTTILGSYIGTKYQKLNFSKLSSGKE